MCGVMFIAVDGDTLANQVTRPDDDQARESVVLRRALGHAELQIGEVLRDTYRIVALLGTGGSGNVFLATHERIPGQVAVKTLRGELIADEESRARFRSEAQIT